MPCGERCASLPNWPPSFAFLSWCSSFRVFVKGHPQDVSTLSSRAKFKPVSNPLQVDIRFFPHLTPTPPTVCLTVSPAWVFRREYEIFTFHIIDPMNDLGVPWTPAVLQFRVSTLETYNLTACCKHREATYDLINLGRSVPSNDACGHSINFTLSLVPSP